MILALFSWGAQQGPSPLNTTLKIETLSHSQMGTINTTIPSRRELDKQKRRKRAKWRGRLLQRGHRLGVIGNKMSSPPHFLPDLEQVIKSLCCCICPAYQMNQTFIRNCFVSLHHCAQQIFLFQMNFSLHPHWDLCSSMSKSDAQTPITEQTQCQGEQNQPNKHWNQIPWAEKVSFVSWWRWDWLAVPCALC